jgi:xanthine dehydrogenase FAD-binding subunit
MEYYTPESFNKASEIATNAQGITRFLAGGTDVLVQLRTDMISPDILIDIKNIPGAKEIECLTDGSWRIGAAVTGAEMSEHSELKAQWPGLVEAMDLIGSTQIQGRATLVGNLCNGSPAADSVPAMMAANASVLVVGPNGTRELSVQDMPVSPGKTSLSKGEVISAVLIPARGNNGGDAYLRFIPRTEMDIAVVGCGVNLRTDGEIITEARLCLGAVTPTIQVVSEVTKLLVGNKLDQTILDAVAKAASAASKPITDKRGTIEYRIEVAGVLAKRATKIAYDRARGLK